MGGVPVHVRVQSSVRILFHTAFSPVWFSFAVLGCTSTATVPRPPPPSTPSVRPTTRPTFSITLTKPAELDDVPEHRGCVYKVAMSSSTGLVALYDRVAIIGWRQDDDHYLVCFIDREGRPQEYVESGKILFFGKIMMFRQIVCRCPPTFW